MGIFYKHFDRTRIVFCAVFFCFLVINAPVLANSIFTVDNVEVDVSADSAVAAREQAFSEAQVKAFEILSQRMLSEDGEVIIPDLMVISSFIKDYEVKKEKLSNVRYIGTYKFRFKEREIKNYFSQSGVSFTDVASKQLLILPFFQREGQLTLWSPYNIWMQAWNRYEGKSALVPVVTPIGDISDVQDIGDGDALSYAPDHLKRLVERYNAGEAVIAIAVPDEDLSSVNKGGEPAAGALRISIYSTDQGAPQLTQELMVEAASGDARDTLYDRAVVKVQQVLQKDWKTKTTVATYQESVYQARVPFQSFSQWTDTQRVLKQVAGVNDVVLKSLSPREARIELVFRGDENRLRLALRQADITMGQGSPASLPSNNRNDWYGGYGQQYAQNYVYDIYLNRYAPRSQSPQMQGGDTPSGQGDGYLQKF